MSGTRPMPDLVLRETLAGRVFAIRYQGVRLPKGGGFSVRYSFWIDDRRVPETEFLRDMHAARGTAPGGTEP